jgi:KDO2-lipid IV(A) lauroyltransferase
MTAPTPAVHPTLGQRLSARALITGVSVIRTLPEGFVYRAAYALGLGLSVVLRSRRRLLRRNLERVVGYLAANGMANSRTAAAARDGRALDSMVRAAFGHWVVTYAESARAPKYDAATLRERVRLEDPEVVHATLAPVAPGGKGVLFVGLHFGAVEIGGLFAVKTGSVPIAGPMESVANPVMREYFERTRRNLGVEVYPIKGIAPILRDRLAKGLGVGLVADRVIEGSGARATLFGVEVRIPAGPAMLAVETGARVCFISVRREDRPGRWIGRVEEVATPAEGSRRERIEAVMEDHARWIERTVATAPEQWWTLLFPVWEDIR